MFQCAGTPVFVSEPLLHATARCCGKCRIWFSVVLVTKGLALKRHTDHSAYAKGTLYISIIII